MNRSRFGRQLTAVLLPALVAVMCTTSAQAQGTEATPRIFTYSILECRESACSRLAQIAETAIPVLVRAGATIYAVWTPAIAPEDAPFVGLTPTQLVVMAAWLGGRVDSAAIDSGLRSLAGVAAVRTEVLDALQLPGGASVSTGTGFYVHREELYRPSDVDAVVRLSREAWVTWEPAWGTRVVGLFRVREASSDTARLLRIAWYRDFDHWSETRQIGKDPESAKRFQARSMLELKGLGVANASDRLVR